MTITSPGGLPNKPHGRPRTPPGEHGTVRVRAVVDRREIPEGQPVPKGAKWRAISRLRLLDGRLVRVEAWGKSKTAAQNAFTARCRELLGPDAINLSSRSLFADAADLYLRWLDEQIADGVKAPTTCDRYRAILNRHVLPALRRLELHEVTPACLTRMLKTVKAQGLSAATLRHVRIVVRDVLQLAVELDVLKANPAKQLAQIRSNTPRKRPRALTPVERDDLLTKLRADTYAVRSSILDLVIFMLGTGCRISEALAVRWRDLDIVGVEAGGLFVPVVYLGPVVVAVKGQGLVRRDKGKTGKDDDHRRPVPLPPWVVDMLVARRPEWALDDDPVFPAQPRSACTTQDVPGAGYRWSHNVLRTWRETRKRHGYEWITPHVFRKTAITEWKRMGLSDLQLADLAGHARVSMTQDVYFDRNRLHPEAANRTGY